MQAVNIHAKSQGCAITKEHTRSSKSRINNVVSYCNYEQQYQKQISLEFKQRITGSHQVECFPATKIKYDRVI